MSSFATGLLILFLSSCTLAALTIDEGVKKVVFKSPEIRESQYIYNEILSDTDIALAPWMPSLFLGAEYGYTKFETGIFEDQTIRRSFLEVRQNLFNGFSDLNTYQVEKARLISAASRILEERNRISSEFIQNFIAVLKNRDLLSISKLSLDNNTKMYKKIKKKVDVGLGRQLEERHSKSTLDLAELTYRIQQRNIEQESIRFSKLLGDKVDVDTLINPKPTICLPDNFEETLKIALKNHPSVLIAKQNIDVVKEEYEQSKKGYFPTLDLRANYYLLNNNSNLQQVNEYDVSVLFNYNIFGGFADINKRQKQQARIFQKNTILQKTERDLKNKLELVWSSLELNKVQYKYNMINVKSKRDTLRSYDYEFMLGRASLNAMLDATETYYNALKDKSEAYYELILDYYRLLEAIGLLYEVVSEEQSQPFVCQSSEPIPYQLELDKNERDPLEYQMAEKHKCYKVLVDKLNIRAEQSVKSKKTGFLIFDTVFCSQERNGQWVRIEKGWVHISYIHEVLIQR